MLMINPYHQTIYDLFEEHAEELDNFGMGRVPEAIEHESRSGFIPFTDGGWRCMIMDDLSRVDSSGSTYAEGPQASLQKAIDYSHDCALEAFIEEYGPQLRLLYDTSDLDLDQQVSYHDLYEKGAGWLAEKLSEAESESLQEGGDFWLELRAQYYSAANTRNETGEDEIWFCAGINLDFQYGRDEGLAETFRRTVKVSELTEEKLAEIVQEMHDSLLAN